MTCRQACPCVLLGKSGLTMVRGALMKGYINVQGAAWNAQLEMAEVSVSD